MSKVQTIPTSNMKPRPGGRMKDAIISGTVNMEKKTGLLMKDERKLALQLMLEKQRKEAEEKRILAGLKKMAERTKRAEANLEAAKVEDEMVVKALEGGLKVPPVKAKSGRPRKKAPEEIPEGDEDKRMLQDMRAVYQNVGGRDALERFIRRNPKAYELMIKELMKLETMIRASELKVKEMAGMAGMGLGGGTVFVVLKGLETAGQQMQITAGDRAAALDMRSVASVLDPGGLNYEEPEDGMAAAQAEAADDDGEDEDNEEDD